MTFPSSAQGQSAANSSQTFNVEAFIECFLAADCNAVELPSHISPEQRREVKKIASQHEGLCCESFGFGAERRLHLFKQKGDGSSRAVGLSIVTVKNTFIDDWLHKDIDEEESEPVIFRSLPVSLNNRKAHDCDERVILSPSDASLSLEASSELEEIRGATDMESGLTTPPEELRFMPGSEVAIYGLKQAPHFNGMTGTVKSFDPETGRYSVLLAVSDSNGKNSAKIKPGNLWFLPGAHVSIYGLTQLPGFNGLTGVVKSFDADTCRYNLFLTSPSPCGKSWAKIKAQHLWSATSMSAVRCRVEKELEKENIPPVPVTPTCTGEGLMLTPSPCRLHPEWTSTKTIVLPLMLTTMV